MNFSFLIKSLFNAILVFLPIILATLLILTYGSGSNEILSLLNNINGNEYPINNILLSYLFAVYIVIFIGLVSYLKGLMDDIFGYSGKSRSVYIYDKFCFWLLISVVICIVAYISFFGVSIFGNVSKDNKLFNMNCLVLFNKYSSLYIFIVFFITDLLNRQSQKIQYIENSFSLNNDISNLGLQKKARHNEINIKLSNDATWFINIPTLTLSLLAIVFTDSVFKFDRFRSFVDQSFINPPEIPLILNEKLYNLFLNGLETGVIVSGIIISQLIFIVLKNRGKISHLEIDRM